MKIAVLSGKGGTGKTFISVNLAYAKGKSVYIDCDVEEPNGRIFLKPVIKRQEQVNVTVPLVDKEKCNGCKDCVNFCKFNALAYVKNRLIIFPELCHGCKGCVLLCSQKALSETKRDIGHIEYGSSGKIDVKTGILNTGEATGVPIVRKLFSSEGNDETVIVDCPPGSSCMVMESIKDADFCLLVTEPTIFGIHNLRMVHELVRLFNKPHGLIINKYMDDKGLVENYCKEEKTDILALIPYDRELGRINSLGLIASEQNSSYLNLFKGIIGAIEKEAKS